ncbi:MAG: hypothetical protein JW910_05805 [Anaerolineae bacterium]|nr:hypothetical protein [Anaerolineae bacterium]
MVSRKRRSDQELLDWSGEHLYYELELFRHCVTVLYERRKFDNEPMMRNALIEAFALSVRTLYDFFFEPVSPRDDDALAIDFYDDPGEWHRNRPVLSEFAKARKRVAKEAAHLTYSRLYGRSQEKRWEWSDVYEQVAIVLEAFVASAPKHRLHPRISGLPPLPGRGHATGRQ